MEAQVPTADECPRVGGMPVLGLGTYRNDDPERCAESVRTALELGYRHVDTARMYGNEAAVGEGIARADVPREEVFVATKVWHDELEYEDVIHAAHESLERMGLEYLDLLYVHWPATTYDAEGALPAFRKLHEEGLIEHVGVSNFTPALLEEATGVLDAPVFANQVEMHVLFQQRELRGFCAERDVTLVAYSPLAKGRVTDVPVLRAIAEDRDATPAQVALAWLREKGVAAIPKAASSEHIRENWASLAVDLSEGEVGRIDEAGRGERLVDPDFAPW